MSTQLTFVQSWKEENKECYPQGIQCIVCLPPSLSCTKRICRAQSWVGCQTQTKTKHIIKQKQKIFFFVYILAGSMMDRNQAVSPSKLGNPAVVFIPWIPTRFIESRVNTVLKNKESGGIEILPTARKSLERVLSLYWHERRSSSQ